MYRLIQSIFLLPRYLERNHQRITKTFEKHGMLDVKTNECIGDRNQEQTSDDEQKENREMVNESKKTD